MCEFDARTTESGDSEKYCVSRWVHKAIEAVVVVTCVATEEAVPRAERCHGYGGGLHGRHPETETLVADVGLLVAVTRVCYFLSVRLRSNAHRRVDWSTTRNMCGCS